MKAWVNRSPRGLFATSKERSSPTNVSRRKQYPWIFWRINKAFTCATKCLPTQDVQTVRGYSTGNT